MKNSIVIRIWSFVCFVICLILWVSNIVFKIGSPVWMLVYIIGPIGIALAVIGKNTLLIVLNAIMSCSFFILMFLGYFFLQA